jgi:ribonuclease T1
MPRTRSPWLSVAAVVFVALVVLLVRQAGGSTSSPGHNAGTGGDGNSVSGTVVASSLPIQAQQTLALIDQGGPFPYDRDAIVFENREGLLPAEKQDYYHEYTVITPGSDDRGARRIIAGSSGELYYTDDHYNSFERITR